jgi:uncharacterized protein (TIGR02594 family)
VALPPATTIILPQGEQFDPSSVESLISKDENTSVEVAAEALKSNGEPTSAENAIYASVAPPPAGTPPSDLVKSSEDTSTAVYASPSSAPADALPAEALKSSGEIASSQDTVDASLGSPHADTLPVEPVKSGEDMPAEKTGYASLSLPQTDMPPVEPVKSDEITSIEKTIYASLSTPRTDALADAVKSSENTSAKKVMYASLRPSQAETLAVEPPKGSESAPPENPVYASLSQPNAGLAPIEQSKRNGTSSPEENSVYANLEAPNDIPVSIEQPKGIIKRGGSVEKPVYAGLGSPEALLEALKWMGANAQKVGVPAHLWCADFMNFVLRRTGYNGTGSRAAREFLKYGRRVDGPRVGAIAIFTRGRNGGHVGIVRGTDGTGNPIIVSGNHGNKVWESVYPKSRVLAYVVPHD